MSMVTNFKRRDLLLRHQLRQLLVNGSPYPRYAPHHSDATMVEMARL